MSDRLQYVVCVLWRPQIDKHGCIDVATSMQATLSLFVSVMAHASGHRTLLGTSDARGDDQIETQLAWFDLFLVVSGVR